jgi:hypothetical protein
MCHRPAQLGVFAFSSMSLSCALAPAAIFKMRCSDRLSPRSGRVRHHLRKPLVRRPSVSRFFNPFRRPLSQTRLSGGLVRITCFGRPLEPFQARCKSSPEATVKFNRIGEAFRFLVAIPRCYFSFRPDADLHASPSLLIFFQNNVGPSRGLH